MANRSDEWPDLHPQILDTNSLPLPAAIRFKLIHAGLRSISDLSGFQPRTLAQEAGLTNEEAVEVLTLANRSHTGEGAENAPGNSERGSSHRTNVQRLTAFELLEREQRTTRITTCCSQLDQLLNGGFCSGEITEICGVPGSGKTQLAIQACTNVQIPREAGGVGASAVYIDTEGSFMIQRVEDVAIACEKRIKDTSQGRFPEFDKMKILHNIHYFRVHDYTEQLAVVNVLDDYIEQNEGIKLVVVDSISFHFRQDFQDMSLRSRLLSGMGALLKGIAEKHQAVVLLTNQVTTKISHGTASVAPALGDTWAHLCTHRIMLESSPRGRLAKVLKSSNLPSHSAYFSIDQGGITDAGL